MMMVNNRNMIDSINRNTKTTALDACSQSSQPKSTSIPRLNVNANEYALEAMMYNYEEKKRMKKKRRRKKGSIRKGIHVEQRTEQTQQTVNSINAFWLSSPTQLLTHGLHSR
jgi:hypothetical protein